eukprot:1447292-Rhodomonas_salina.1
MRVSVLDITESERQEVVEVTSCPLRASTAASSRSCITNHARACQDRTLPVARGAERNACITAL